MPSHSTSHRHRDKLSASTSPSVPPLGKSKTGHSKMLVNRTTVPDESVKLRMSNLEYVWELDEFLRLRRLCEMNILPIDGVKVRSQSFGSTSSGQWFLELYPGRSSAALREQRLADAHRDDEGPHDEGGEGDAQRAEDDQVECDICEGENCIIFLHLDTTRTSDAMSEFYFYLLDEEGKKIEGFKKGAKTFQLSRAEGDPPPCQGCSIPNTDLHRYLRGGRLTVRIEMCVYRGLDFPTFGPPTLAAGGLTEELSTVGLGGDTRLSRENDRDNNDSPHRNGRRTSSFSSTTRALSDRGAGVGVLSHSMTATYPPIQYVPSPHHMQPHSLHTHPYIMRHPAQALHPAGMHRYAPPLQYTSAGATQGAPFSTAPPPAPPTYPVGSPLPPVSLTYGSNAPLLQQTNSSYHTLAPQQNLTTSYQGSAPQPRRSPQPNDTIAQSGHTPQSSATFGVRQTTTSTAPRPGGPH